MKKLNTLKNLLSLIFIFPLVLSVMSKQSAAQTSVPGGLVSGTWMLAGSPYLIQGSVQINNGATLTIEPGVIVNFQGSYKFNVQGRLIAIGTASDSIIFTAANPSDGWKGVRFEDTPLSNDSSKIKYCKFKYGNANGSGYDAHGGGLFFKNFTKAIVSNCQISYCNAVNGGGMYCFSSSNISFYNNLVCNNTSLYGGGIYIDGCNPIISGNIISNNTANYGGGFYFVYCSPNISNNTITNNTAINGGAIACRLIAHPAFQNTIIWGNTASLSGSQVFLETEDSDPDFYYCDIQGGNVAFGLNGNIYTGAYQNNINSDPLFVSPSAGSGTGFNGSLAIWSLQSSSPCIDHADPGATYLTTDFAGNPRVTVCRADIGAYEFQTGIPLSASLNILQPILCNGASTGSVSASPSGGASPYTFLWSNGQSTATINGLSAGIYTVTVSETSAGCTISKSITFTQPLATIVEAGADSTVVCGESVHLNANPESTLLYSGTLNNLYSASFTDSDFGYVIGDKGISGTEGKILKTTDGGTTWSSQSITNWTTQGMSPYNFYSVDFINKDTGLIVGGNDWHSFGLIAKTTDGGTHWSSQITNILSFNSICFTDIITAYAVGVDSIGNGHILKTTDSGINWSPLSIGTTSELKSVFFIDSSTGYVVGQGGTILKTINSGATWIPQISGTTNDLYSVFFSDINIGYAVGNNGTILHTLNGGNNWTTQVSGTTASLHSINFPESNKGFAVGTGGKILYTYNGGTDWIQYFSGLTNLNSIQCLNSGTGYIVGDYGKIIKFTNPASFSWSPATGLSATNISNPIANPTETTTYTVTATTAEGCTATDNVTVTISSLTANAGNDKTIICGGSAQLDNVTSNYTGSGTLTYTWSPASGLNNSAVMNPIATVVADTKYFVTVSTPNGCIAIDSVTVHLNPLIANAGNDKTIICGGSAQLDNVTSNYTGTGTLTYNWSPTTGLNDSTIINPTATVIAETKYFVTVTTPNGCAAIDSIIVHVNPLIANAGNDKLIICGGTAQLDNVMTNYTGTGTLTYLWSPTTGLNDSTIINPTATVIAETKYFVTITTPNGCNAIDSVVVHVNSLTAEAGTIKSIICGGIAQLDNVTSNYTGTGTLSYAWSPTTGLSDSTISNPTTTATGIAYTVTVSTPNGCSATDNVYVNLVPMDTIGICIVGVDSTNKNVIIWDKPVSAAIDSFYIYRETNITGQYAKIGSVYYDSMSVYRDTLSFPDVQSNKYKISIKDSCGLESAKSAYHKTMHLAINQGMGTVWNLIWEQYEGFTVTTYNIYRGTAANNLQLIGSTSGGSNQYTDNTAPTGYVYYQVEVMSPNSCYPSKSYNSSRSNIATNNTIGVNEFNENSSSISIYPNPANENITIENIVFTKGDVVQIYNVHGQLLMQQNLLLTKTEINVSSFAKGVYAVKLSNSDYTVVKRFVKE